MRKLITLLLSILLVQGLCAQSMSDKQVLDYVKSSMSQGKSQSQITTELARRGVTKEQALRVKAMYEKEMASETSTGSTVTDGDRQRKVSLTNQSQRIGSETADEPIVEENVWSGQKTDETTKLKVYGRNIFNNGNLTFEPSQNLATPADYRLGPNDEVFIDIWGTNQVTFQKTISPDGYITIEDLGLIYLSGKTVDEATRYLRKELNKIYTGLDSEDATSSIKVSVGSTRTIQVNVMGEVKTPGTYSLSSFSSVFHALYCAGGVSDIGSLRSVKINRKGKTVYTMDVYDFIMNGKTTDDIRLQEGDVIIVPPYEALVTISGKVKRPMTYEMKKNESMATLLRYAGGFTSDAYTRSLRNIRQNGREYRVNIVDEFDYTVFHMQDGDEVFADSMLQRFENKLEIKGAVYHPGIYGYTEALGTVRSLVEKAEGLMGDAFTGRAVLYRERENLTREVIQVDILGIMGGTVADIPLKPNDVLYIPSMYDLSDLGQITIEGEVAFPGDIAYADNMTLEDAIIQAGGLLESASTVRVDVSRRVKDNKSTKSASTIAEFYTFALKDGFVIEGEPGFVLQPYDQVYVRRSPGYIEQINVEVKGEVLFEGKYTLTSKGERLSSLIKKAGGITDYAYARGAKLIRKATADEIVQMQETLAMMRKELGEGAVDSMGITVKSTFTVGIDLEKALANPGSEADIQLREGDILTVSELSNTVTIDGAVLYPNTVSFSKGMRLKKYIAQAGGYSEQAKKSKTFVIYANGQVAEASSSSSLIQPGCRIVVPTRSKHRTWNLQSILGIASSLGSLGLTAASVANILK